MGSPRNLGEDFERSELIRAFMSIVEEAKDALHLRRDPVFQGEMSHPDASTQEWIERNEAQLLELKSSPEHREEAASFQKRVSVVLTNQLGLSRADAYAHALTITDIYLMCFGKRNFVGIQEMNDFEARLTEYMNGLVTPEYLGANGEDTPLRLRRRLARRVLLFALDRMAAAHSPRKNS